MNPGWAGVLVGVFLGFNAGVLIMAMFALSGKASRHEEAYEAGRQAVLDEMRDSVVRTKEAT